MRFNRLDLNLLVCLDALIAEKSVTKAANRVFIGQSAMSLALGRLREYFKDDILVQVGRSMALSPLAQELAKPVRDVLLQMRAITSATAEFDPARSERRISLAASDYVASVFLTALLPRVYSKAPHITFELHNLGARFQEDFDSGEVEMMIVPRSLLLHGHPSEDLFEETFSCVAWSKNRLVRDTLSMEQYLSLGHVGWAAGRFRTPDEEALRKSGKTRRIEVLVPSFYLAAPLVVGTHRIATVQTRLARLAARQWPLKMLPCPVRFPPLAIAVQWHKHLDRDPAIGWLRDQLRMVAAQLK